LRTGFNPQVPSFTVKLYDRIRTPCIGVCSTGIGDTVCRGCKRFDFEVIGWNGFSDAQKRAVDDRLAELLAKVVSARFEIADENLLKRQLQLQQIRYAHWRNAYCWLFDLLRAGAAQIDDPRVYGFRLRSLAASKTLAEVRGDIEAEYYALSVAHYERYIVANRQRAITT
jgi:predicted Fe-S protein YdhL (DUF1289 family)